MPEQNVDVTNSLEEKFYRLKFAMRKIAEAMHEDALPKDPNVLLAIGLLAPNLGGALAEMGTAIFDVRDILDNEPDKKV